MQDTVSIIVPVYNAASFLPANINSILEQTYKNIELILVNDGSKDSSLEVCQKFAQQDSRVIVIDQPNGGASAARFTGVTKANGDWIVFVDSDDTIPPTAIQALVENSVDCEIVIGHVSVNANVSWNYPVFSEVLDTQKALKYLFNETLHSGPVAKLFKKKLFDKIQLDIPKEITHGEDFIMNYALFQEAAIIKVIENKVYNYIYRESSVSNSRNPYRSLNYCKMQEQCLDRLTKKENKAFMQPWLRKNKIMHRKRILKLFIKQIIGHK